MRKILFHAQSLKATRPAIFNEICISFPKLANMALIDRIRPQEVRLKFLRLNVIKIRATAV